MEKKGGMNSSECSSYDKSCKFMARETFLLFCFFQNVEIGHDLPNLNNSCKTDRRLNFDD